MVACCHTAQLGEELRRGKELANVSLSLTEEMSAGSREEELAQRSGGHSNTCWSVLELDSEIVQISRVLLCG